MNNNDRQTLTPKVAQEFIQELFAGQTVQLQQIKEKIDEVYEGRGGKRSSAKYHPVMRALSKMKREGLADNAKSGRWSIFSGEPSLIKSLDQFMKWIQELPDGNYVYRGVSNKDYPIEASTYRRLKNEKGEIRDEDKTAERLLQVNREMIEDAKRHKHGWENDQPPRDLDLLAKLQHSGAATCLIDFTKNPLVALWMACRKSSSGSVPGKVYAVKIGQGSPFKDVSFNDVGNGINHFFQRHEKTGYRLYQWQPDYQDNRMLAQQSIFLFGGGWGEIKESEACVISGQHKKEFRDSLKKSAGISEDILFPDFDGFASQRAQNKAYNQPDVSIHTDPKPTPNEDNQTEYSVIYYLQLSLEAFREGNTEEGLNYYNSGIGFEPSDELLSTYYRERAIIHYEKGYFRSAILDFDYAIRFNSDDADSHFWRGRTNYAMGGYRETMKDFDKSIAINSNNAYAFYWRGMAKYDLKKYEEAKDDFDIAINLNSTDGYFYRWRGMASFNLNLYQDAIRFFDRSIILNPSDMYSYHWLGMAKYHLQEYAKSIDDFNKTINLNPTDVNTKGHTFYWRGMAKKQIGVFNAARADFNMALMCAEETGDYDLQDLIRQELLPH